MDKEENLRKSFRNLKEDIELIKKSLSEATKSISEISPKIQKKIKGKSEKIIYTSKPTITSGMLDAVEEVF